MRSPGLRGIDVSVYPELPELQRDVMPEQVLDKIEEPKGQFEEEGEEKSNE